MLFNSFGFFVFFALVVTLYYILSNRLKKYLLLISSLFFYGCWNYRYLLLLVAVIGMSYTAGLLIAGGKRKTGIIVSVIALTLILIFFKYYNWIVESIETVQLFRDVGITLPLLNVVLPVGISFYTFQAVGYTIDVYRNPDKVEKSIINYSLYISFFPQLVAGPIERAEHFLVQIDRKHLFKWDNLYTGGLYILWGLFLKMVIADRLSAVVDAVFDNYQQYPGVYIVIGMMAFSIQIYCDFCGYSTIAVGAARILDYELVINFKQPYFATSVKEFWKRWHISLTSWFRDYIYIPLGGSRKGKFCTFLNSICVFSLSGLWHGAGLHFVVWGGINGLMQETERMLNIGVSGRKVLRIFQMAVTFCIVTISWLFFRAASIGDAVNMLVYISKTKFMGRIGDGIYLPGIENEVICVLLFISLVFLFIKSYMSEYMGGALNGLSNCSRAVRWIILAVLFYMIVLVGVYGGTNNENAFIYFRF